jgi:membrane fusion protein (multidrug efflux system)
MLVMMTNLKKGADEMKQKTGLLLIGGLVILAVGLGIVFSREKSSAQDRSQSMEQIHQETGIPVKIQEVTPTPFTTVLKYSATVRACSEAVAYSRVSDVVRDVLFKVGDYVRENQTVVTFPKDNQASQYYQLKAGYELAESTYRRMTQLYSEGVISKQELDNARTNYEVAKANMNVSDDSLRVKAPLSGYITQLNVKPTDNVKKEAPLFTVSNLDRMEAQFWVSSQEISQIKQGQKVTLNWAGQSYSGVVAQVGRIMDPGRKAFEVKARFANKDQHLTSGVTADIAIETYYNDQAIKVARKNLGTADGQSYVYVVEDGVAHKRAVKIGAELGNAVEVLSGLNPGDRLIVEGNSMVSDKVKVKIVKS